MRLRPRRTSALQAQFIELERRRLALLLDEWLELERARPPFQVIACEEDSVASVGGLELRLRLDRVDRLAFGEEMLIDYKSTASPLTTWFGDRPDEPQLPLYAVTRARAPRVLAFAHVERGESEYLGLSADVVAAAGVRPYAPGRFDDPADDWGELVGNWRVTLERLAESFRSGQVPVAPKKRSETCGRCEFSLLCRVSELLDRGAPGADD
jgi:RecB family exonuclease